MICPKCKHEFKFSSVPMMDREYNAWTCNFKCPVCKSWLSPSKRKRVLYNIGVIGFAVAAFGMALEIQLTNSINSRLLGVIFVPSLIVLVIASRDKSADLLKRKKSH